MWRIALAAVLGTVLVLGLIAAGYAVYHQKANQISQLEGQGQQLRATNATLYKQLRDTRVKLVTANTTVTTTQKHLTRAKTSLTKMSKELGTANQRADANYNSGVSAGNSAGYVAGNSSGYESGLTAGSDQLTCSDDPDVYWLPACY
jgi:cell division protein FtsB